jgi:spermidine synthase
VEYYADGALVDRPFAYNPGKDHIDTNIQKAFETTSLAKLQRPSVLILGLGCGRAAHVLEELLPSKGVSADFVEIDEAVIYAAKHWFCLPEREGFRYIQDDAFAYVSNLPANKAYDYIMLDVFKGSALPQKFKEERFFRMLRERVNEFGLVSMNVSPASLVEEDELDAKAKAVFKHVDIDYFAGNAFIHMRKQYEM